MCRAQFIFVSVLCAAFLLTEEGFFVPQAYAAQSSKSVEKRKEEALAKARARLKAKSARQAKTSPAKTAATKPKPAPRKNKPSVAKKPATPAAPAKTTRSATQEKTTLVRQQRSVRTELTTLQKDLAQKVIAEDLNVRQLEKIISDLSKPKKKEGKNSVKLELDKNLKAQIKSVEKALMQKFGTKVKIAVGNKKGKIEIDYYNSEELERLINILNK